MHALEGYYSTVVTSCVYNVFVCSYMYISLLLHTLRCFYTFLQACMILLTLPLPPKTGEGSRAYNIFYSSLVSLLCCGVDYSMQCSKLQERVLLACASHQCFSLTMNLLSSLPPSFDILSAALDGNRFSCKVCVGNGHQHVLPFTVLGNGRQHVHAIAYYSQSKLLQVSTQGSCVCAKLLSSESRLD